MWQVWLVIAGVFFVAEAITIGFLLFWFGIGALLAMISSFFTDNLIIQTTIFVVSSTLLLFLTKPFLKKFSVCKEDETVTNAYSIINKTGIVTKDIDNISGLGQIKIGSEIWSAKSFDGSNIPKGTKITVIDIDGVKAVVDTKVPSIV